jgi:hypothetical protein
VFSIIIAGLTPASTLVTKSDEEPGCVGEDWTVGWDLPLDMLFTDSNMLRVEHLHLAPR